MAIIPIIVGVSAASVFVLLLINLFSRTERSRKVVAEFDEEWLENFSAFRYLPMRRLLHGNDEAFLQRQEQGGTGTLREFRAERRMLYRMYLQDLKADFERLSLGAKMAILAATEDQSDQVALLLRLEWQFRRALWFAHAQVALHALGLRTADSTSLINAMQHFEFTLREVCIAQAQPNA